MSWESLFHVQSDLSRNVLRNTPELCFHDDWKSCEINNEILTITSPFRKNKQVLYTFYSDPWTFSALACSLVPINLDPSPGAANRDIEYTWVGSDLLHILPVDFSALIHLWWMALIPVLSTNQLTSRKIQFLGRDIRKSTKF